MATWPWRWMFVGIVLTLVILVLITPDPANVGLTSASTDELVGLLGSPQPALRRAAVEQLIARSKTIVPALVSVAIRSHGAHLDQTLDVLEELLIGLDPVVSEEVESALEKLLVHEEREVAAAAAYVMYRNSTLRHAKAVAQVERLGGVVRSESHEVLVYPGSARRIYDPWEFPNESRKVTFLNLCLLDDSWTGGDEGLKYVARLFPDEGLAVHLVDGVAISEEAIEQFRESRAMAIVRRPHEGCLGLLLDDLANTVIVSGVLPDSPADRGGLKPGDVIHQVGDLFPQTKPELLAYVQTLRPGDKAAIVVRRRGEALNFDIRLSSDFGTGLCRCAD